MGVLKRLDEAETLWRAGHREGAWIMTMIAAAATARKRYPRPIPDNEAFKKYIYDETWVILKGEPKPNHHKGTVQLKLGDRLFQDILYEDYRCFWIHEAALDGAGLSETQIKDNTAFRTLVVGKNTQIPDDWVWNLMAAIRLSPENRD